MTREERKTADRKNSLPVNEDQIDCSGEILVS